MINITPTIALEREIRVFEKFKNQLQKKIDIDLSNLSNDECNELIIRCDEKITEFQTAIKKLSGE